MVFALSGVASSLLSGVACGVANLDNGAPDRVYLFNCFSSGVFFEIGFLKFVEMGAGSGGMFSFRGVDLGGDLEIEGLSAAAETVVADFLAALVEAGLGDTAAVPRLACAMAGSDRLVPILNVKCGSQR